MRHEALIVMATLCGVAVAADGLPKDTNEIKSLTVEQAEALAQRKRLAGPQWPDDTFRRGSSVAVARMVHT
jgi:hypothetical protein